MRQQKKMSRSDKFFAGYTLIFTAKTNPVSPLFLRKLEIDKYRADPALDYSRSRPSHDYFEQFLNWLFQLIFSHKISDRDLATIWAFMILCSVVLILFVISRLLGIHIFWFIKRQSPAISKQPENQETDIHAIDFSLSIEQAIELKDYRAAVRFRYMQTLKQLNDQHFILWSKEKTNQHYLNELKKPVLKSGFSKITRSYEYVVYGHFSVDEAGYSTISSEFADFSISLRK